MTGISDLSLWRVFIKRYQLTEQQTEQFKRYFQALEQWHEFGNITAITDERDVVDLHFDDALAVTKFIDFSRVKTIADIGSGSGVPGIPLAIRFPHMQVYLLEVKHKKIAFLEQLVQHLALPNITIVPLDWRTFLRKTSYTIDLFCARASLAPRELIRMFKPSSPYRHGQLIYWAVHNWQAQKCELPFIKERWQYHVSGRLRQLVLFQSGGD
jgi:16S rRNA (guanine(527)-N(7))-methyltransferase RsmG